VWDSIGEYVPAVFKELWGLAVGGVLAIIGVIALHVTVQIPWWTDLLVVAVCLSPAQFMAFHRVRVARDAAEAASPEPATTTNTTMAIEILNVENLKIVMPAVIEPPQAGPGDQQ
jgi:hypothetical protein